MSVVIGTDDPKALENGYANAIYGCFWVFWPFYGYLRDDRESRGSSSALLDHISACNSYKFRFSLIMKQFDVDASRTELLNLTTSR